MNNIMTSLVEDTISTRYSLLSRLEDRGDQDSWRDFFNTYWRFIYSVALKSGLTEAEAQDVVQETVISVARDIHNSSATVLWALSRVGCATSPAGGLPINCASESAPEGSTTPISDGTFRRRMWRIFLIRPQRSLNRFGTRSGGSTC